MKAKISGVGSFLPQKLMTNDDISKIVDTSNEWIVERTGITQRYIAEGMLTSDLAFNAAKNALGNVKHIDGIIIATTTPDLIFPSTACIVQGKLAEIGISSHFAFDIQAVCSGFVYAMHIANMMISSGANTSILVIGAETLSRILDWTDRTTCVLFGDGAGAVLLTASQNSGIIYSSIHSNGRLSDILKTTGGISSGNLGHITMEGKAVFKHAVTKMEESIRHIASTANISLDDIDWIVPHQANIRILTAVAERLGIPQEKFIITVESHANTSAASIPLALDHAKSKFKSGDKIILEALGGGITWGGLLLEW